MDELLEELLEECRPYTKMGHVATYIPELAKRNPDKLGIYILNSNGQLLCLGEHYKTKRLCQNAVESVKRFALNSPVLANPSIKK